MNHPYHSDALPFATAVALLQNAPWRRVAVLGDSIAEGVREPASGYRDLSWVDRITEPLAAVVPGVTVMNLGRRDRSAADVRERQLATALDFEPDLAIVAAGGNDALTPSFAPAAVERELDAIAGALRGVRADVLMLELLAVPRAPALDQRLALLATITRATASRHGAMVVGMREHPASADQEILATDGMHLNSRGHAIVGAEAIRRLSRRSVIAARPGRMLPRARLAAA